MSKEKKNNLVPNLRFPKFRNEPAWDEQEFGNLTYPVSERNKKGKKYPIYSISNVVGFLPQAEQFEDLDSHSRGYDITLYKVIKKNTFAYNPARINVGSIGYSGNLNNVLISSLYVCFKTRKQLDDHFLLQYLKSYNFNKSVTKSVEGGIRSYLFYENFAKIRVQFPSLGEQQKIASFLSSFDERISIENQKLNILKTHKKGLMQQLFPGEGETLPKFRFKEFNKYGKWLYKYGHEMFHSISDKNHQSDLPILAITQDHGAIPRDQINYTVIATESSVASYKVVHKGDFIISLRSFQGGIEYSEYNGICSPAYVILRKICDLHDNFFKYYFKTDLFIANLNKNIEGIRDGKMVSYKQFSELRLPVPSPEEQKKIALCLSSIDELIGTQVQKIDALKEQKKGLVQRLFPI